MTFRRSGIVKQRRHRVAAIHDKKRPRLAHAAADLLCETVTLSTLKKASSRRSRFTISMRRWLRIFCHKLTPFCPSPPVRRCSRAEKCGLQTTAASATPTHSKVHILIAERRFSNLN